MEILFSKIRTFFTQFGHSQEFYDQRKIRHQYNVILTYLRTANNLALLLMCRKEIEKFEKMTVDYELQEFGKPYCDILMSVWNRKFQLWKGI